MRPLREVFQIGAVGCGVDIGESTIKVAEVRRTARGLELSRFGTAPTPSGAVAGGIILDQPGTAGTVAAVLRSAGVRRRSVNVSVRGQNVLARILRLPPIPEDEVKQAIRWEAERHLPFPVEQAVLDAQVVREVTEDGQRQIEVLLAAAPESLVLTYIETMGLAGLEVEAVEVGALAMVRLLALTTAHGTAAMVNLGTSTTDVAIVHDGIPQFTRTVPEGVGGTGTRESLTLQLRRTFDFYRAQYGGAQVDRIVICGTGARTPSMDRHLAIDMEVPVTIGTPLGALQLSSRLQPATVKDVAPLLTIAAGLALRAVA